MTRLWEMHKRFIIGLVGTVLLLFVLHQFFVAPLNKKAQARHKDASTNSRKLKQMFSGEAGEAPTEVTKRKYRDQMLSLNSELDQVKRSVGFPVQAPFILPTGEKMDTYYQDVSEKTMSEVRRAAAARAIIVGSGVSSVTNSADTSKPGALVMLAVVRRALLMAIASGVTILENVSLNAGERSAPISDHRLSEKLVTVTVRGSSEAVQRWMSMLGRRESFLMIVAAKIRPPERGAEEDHGTIQATVTLGPLTVEKVKSEEEAEEDDYEE